MPTNDDYLQLLKKAMKSSNFKHLKEVNEVLDTTYKTANDSLAYIDNKHIALVKNTTTIATTLVTTNNVKVELDRVNKLLTDALFRLKEFSSDANALQSIAFSIKDQVPTLCELKRDLLVKQSELVSLLKDLSLDSVLNELKLIQIQENIFKQSLQTLRQTFNTLKCPPQYAKKKSVVDTFDRLVLVHKISLDGLEALQKTSTNPMSIVSKIINHREKANALLGWINKTIESTGGILKLLGECGIDVNPQLPAPRSPYAAGGPTLNSAPQLVAAQASQTVFRTQQVVTARR